MRCEFVFVHPRPTDGELRHLYKSGDFGAAARGPGSPDPVKVLSSEGTAVSRYMRLEQYLPEADPKTAVDVGCGMGSTLWLLKARGFEVTGLEPDPSMSTAGRAMYDIDIQQTLYEEFSIDADSVGVAILSHVLEHVPDPRSFVARLARDLSPTGVAYIEIPSISRPYGGDLESFFWSAHLNSFTPRGLERLLAEAGLGVSQDGWAGDFYWAIVGHKFPTRGLEAPAPMGTLARSRLAHLLHESRDLAPDPLRRATRRVKGWGRWLLEDPRDFTSAALTKATRLVRHAGSTFPPLVAHIAHHDSANAGDTLLSQATRDLWEKHVQPVQWMKREIFEPVNEEYLEDLSSADTVLVGGGGLFLKDTNSNKASGWQWAVRTDDLKNLRPPLVVFGVGYNRFRGQEEFDEPFQSNVTALVAKARFIGLRNRGSVRALREYLPDQLHSRVRFQPCPTVHLRRLNPTRETSLDRGDKTLALNVAFDRRLLRFGSPRQEDQVMSSVATALRALANDGWTISLVLNIPADAAVVPWLEAARVPYQVTDLSFKPPADIISFYQRQSITIGMRGHSQMIPFGLGNAILSLITHDKLSWFLQDIEHEDWGLEGREPNLDEAIVDHVRAAGGAMDKLSEQVREAESKLWRTTQANTQQLRSDIAEAEQ